MRYLHVNLRNLTQGHDRLHYMAPMQNAPSIAALGIYSFNHGQKVIPAELRLSIADPAVNQRRHGITFGAGNRLHDFVPLYWATHTPMQYVLTVRDGTVDQDDLIFFVCDARKIFALPEVWTTDGNAANGDTEFAEGPGALGLVDWDIVETRDAWTRTYRRRKCAEVLVREHVPSELLAEMCVRSQAAAQELKRRIDAMSSIFAIQLTPALRPDLYYP